MDKEYKMKNNFEIFYKFIGWNCISLGIHFDWEAPRLEIHIPFGWIRIGWNKQTGRKMKGWEDGLYSLTKSK